MRSRSAAAILDSAGFRQAYSMAGGIRAYNGITAKGDPEAGMAWFPEGMGTPELTALAWLLEDGTGKFYSAVCEGICKEAAHRDLISSLEAAEDAHKARLMEAYKATGQTPEADFPRGLIEMPEEDTMEGGITVAEALAWAREKPMSEVLGLMISLEANALDLYVRMSRRVDEEAAKVFLALSDEERTHLDKLAGALKELT